MSTAEIKKPGSSSQLRRRSALLVQAETTTEFDAETLFRQQAPDNWSLRRAFDAGEAALVTQSRFCELAIIAHGSRLNALEVVDVLRKRSPQTGLVVALDDKDRPLVSKFLRHGADGYLLLSHFQPDRLEQVVQLALHTARVRLENHNTIRQFERSREEQDYLVRALSHDLSANFMLLESSFGRLRQQCPSLAEGPPSAELEHVEACLQQSRRFVDDLVQLARTGNIDMEPEHADTESVVDEVLFEQRELIEQVGATIEVRRPLSALWCNRRRLKQIVTNLVRNALKHGCDPQVPRIEIETQCDPHHWQPDGGTTLVTLRVADNGPGIASEHHHEIFLPGRRLANTMAGGNGMGLAIVRKIAEHYGGEADIDSQFTGGTAFQVTLPVAVEDSSHWWGADQSHGKPLRASASLFGGKQSNGSDDPHRPQPHGPF